MMNYGAIVKRLAWRCYTLGILSLVIGILLSFIRQPVSAAYNANGIDDLAISRQAGIETCVFDFKCEGGCNPDPIFTYTAPPGYLVCKVVIKEATEVLVFTSDGCVDNSPPGGDGLPDYCASGIGSGEAVAERLCEENGQNECHQISYSSFWINPAPPTDTPVPTDSPTPTNTEVPTDTPTPTDTPSPTDPPTPTPTNTDIPTDTPTPTDTPVFTDTPSPTPTQTEFPTNTPTQTDTPALTDTPTATPTQTEIPAETPTPTGTQEVVTPTPSETVELPTPTATITPPQPSATVTSTPLATETSVPPTATNTQPAPTEQVTATSVGTDTPLPPGEATRTPAPPSPVPTLPPPQPSPVPSKPPVLIPVTGDVLPVQINPMEPYQRIFLNIGLGFIGLALVLHAYSIKLKKEDAE